MYISRFPTSILIACAATCALPVSGQTKGSDRSALTRADGPTISLEGFAEYPIDRFLTAIAYLSSHSDNFTEEDVTVTNAFIWRFEGSVGIYRIIMTPIADGPVTCKPDLRLVVVGILLAGSQDERGPGQRAEVVALGLAALRVRGRGAIVGRVLHHQDTRLAVGAATLPTARRRIVLADAADDQCRAELVTEAQRLRAGGVELDLLEQRSTLGIKDVDESTGLQLGLTGPDGTDVEHRVQ